MPQKIVIPDQGTKRRTSSIFLHIGAKKTGKTQGTLNMIVEMYQKQAKPVLVLDKGRQSEYDDFIDIELDDLPKFNALANRQKIPLFKCRISGEEDVIKFFELVDQYIRNSFVVFEDATTYAVGNLPLSMRNLIVNSRNACNDYLFNLHSLSEPAPFLFRHSEYIILRRTSDQKLQTKVPVPNKILRAMYELEKENKREYPRVDQPKLAFRLIDITSAD
ncbi:hypothetical protein [Spirosoma pomorum]